MAKNRYLAVLVGQSRLNHQLLKLTVILNFAAALTSATAVPIVSSLTTVLVSSPILSSKIFLLSSSVPADLINGRFLSAIATSFLMGCLKTNDVVESSELSELDSISRRSEFGFLGARPFVRLGTNDLFGPVVGLDPDTFDCDLFLVEVLMIVFDVAVVVASVAVVVGSAVVVVVEVAVEVVAGVAVVVVVGVAVEVVAGVAVVVVAVAASSLLEIALSCSVRILLGPQISTIIFNGRSSEHISSIMDATSAHLLSQPPARSKSKAAAHNLSM